MRNLKRACFSFRVALPLAAMEDQEAMYCNCGGLLWCSNLKPPHAGCFSSQLAFDLEREKITLRYLH